MWGNRGGLGSRRQSEPGAGGLEALFLDCQIVYDRWWEVQAGDNESEEELNGTRGMGGIMKHTEVYMRSEASP